MNNGGRHARWLGAVALLLVLDVSLGVLHVTWVRHLERRAMRGIEELELRYRTAHPYYHHDLVPNYEGTAAWGPYRYPIHTNSLGFRDARVRNVPIRADRFRILLIGDSFAEGLGIDYDSTLSGLLTHTLGSRGIEVLNGAVTTYSPAIYWKKVEHLLERRGLLIDAVVIFLDISDIQDEALAYRIDGTGRVVAAPHMPYDMAADWRRTSLMFRVAWRGVQMLYPHPPWIGCSAGRGLQPWVEAEGAICRSAWTLSRVAMNRYGRDGLRRADEHMTHLARLLRLYGIRSTVVVYPWPQQLLWNDRHSLQVSYWRGWAQREQAEFIDLFEPFFGAVDTLGATEAIRRYFLEGDMHWNVSGHRLVAENIMRHFTRLVPENHATQQRTDAVGPE